jgi:hypothetical protein
MAAEAQPTMWVVTDPDIVGSHYGGVSLHQDRQRPYYATNGADHADFYTLNAAMVFLLIAAGVE